MYCLALYAYFREESGIFPLDSFEFMTDDIDGSFIERKKREVGSRCSSGNVPSILVHGIFRV